MEDRIKILISAGAAVAANCQPCLQAIRDKALESGIDEREVAIAIEVGKLVRKGAASKMDAFIAGLNQQDTPECGCI